VDPPLADLLAHLLQRLRADRRLEAVNIFPSALLAPLGRNMYPRNVNEVCSCEPRRLPSLQYTILVLACAARIID